jgi:hypothetical protein
LKFGQACKFVSYNTSSLKIMITVLLIAFSGWLEYIWRSHSIRPYGSGAKVLISRLSKADCRNLTTLPKLLSVVLS